MAHVANDAREIARAWLLQVKEATGWSWTKIARRAGLAPSTLTKAKDPDHTSVITTTTIRQVAEATGIAAPASIIGGGGGFAEPIEATPYRGGRSTDFDLLVRSFIGDDDGRVPWTLATRALELAGYLPGDVVILDMNATPRPGDVVCAQVYDFEREQAQTIWRHYQPPFLVPATTDRSLMTPETTERARIKGVVVMSLRPRAGA